MSDNMENEGKAGGESGTPTQTTSQTQTSQTSSVDAKVLETYLEKVDRIESLVRSLQGEKDRGVHKVAKDVNTLNEQVNRIIGLVKDGKNESDIARELAIDELVRERLSGHQEPEVRSTEQVGSQPVTKSSISDLTIESYAKFLGVEPTSADYVELLRTASGKEDLLQKVYDLSERRKQASTASAGGVMPTGQGAAPEKQDADTIAAQLEELYKYPSKNKKEIERLSAEYDKLMTRK